MTSVESLSPPITCLSLSVKSALTQRRQADRWLWTRAAVTHRQGLDRPPPPVQPITVHYSVTSQVQSVLTLTVPLIDSYTDRDWGYMPAALLCVCVFSPVSSCS